MFVNMANGQRGLVCHYDVVCFDEIAGISFDQKDGVNIMKGYMASGEFSRGKEARTASGLMAASSWWAISKSTCSSSSGLGIS
jgi:ATP-dependent Lon protease